MHSNSDVRQSPVHTTDAPDSALESGSRTGPRRGRPRSGTQTRIASFRLSAENFRVLSENRLVVQQCIEKKLAELLVHEEEAIRAKCANELVNEPYDWEKDWSDAGVTDALNHLPND